MTEKGPEGQHFGAKEFSSFRGVGKFWIAQCLSLLPTQDNCHDLRQKANPWKIPFFLVLSASC